MAPLLLDTHALLWWLDGDTRLRPRARGDRGHPNQVMVSAASAWEITTKHRVGKLPGAADVARRPTEIAPNRASSSPPITDRTGRRRAACPARTAIPFDRMLIAQAREEKLALVSNESAFDAYGVTRVW